MSAGRSSHVAACFSVERTKYLMLSKSMPSRLEPHCGIGFLLNVRSARSRLPSIPSGSFFFDGAHRAQPTLEHPPRLVFFGRDVTHYRFGQSALRAGARLIGVHPAV